VQGWKSEKSGVVNIEVMRTIEAPERKRQNRWVMVLRSPLWLCLLLAIVVRVVLIVHTNGVIDGDESLVGIQAQHILQGERPIYFYGIPYFGSLEAYLVAFVFALVGSSVWALRAEPTVVSLLIVWLTWRLAAALAEQAQLSRMAQRYFMLVAALVAAVFPLYDTVLEIRTFGGYVEIFVLMQLLLLGALRLTQRWNVGASTRELVLRWAAIGFVVGLGLWVDPLIISAVLVAVLWILGYCVYALQRSYHSETPTNIWPGVRSVGKRLLLAVVTIPAALLGCAPALYWGATHQWENVQYILNLGNGYASLSPAVRSIYPTRLALTAGLVKLYTTCIVPRIIGGALPSESGRLLTTLHTFTLAIGVICIVTTIGLLALSFIVRHPFLLQARQLATLPLLFAVSTAFFFCTSTAAVAGLGCTRDLAGRYATPFMLALPFFLATVFTVMYLYLQKRSVQATPTTDGRNAVVPIGNAGIRSLQRLPLVRVALLAVLCIYLLAQAATYRLTDAGHTFQSPYCTLAPALNDQIIAYLQRQHIRYAWAANWVGYPMIFKTGGSLTLADPQPAMKNMAYFNRFPADVVTVLHADRASFLVIVAHGDRHPQLLKLFDAEHVTYSAVFFPSEAESDILVVTPLSRSVSPFESDVYFGIFHCSR